MKHIKLFAAIIALTAALSGCRSEPVRAGTDSAVSEPVTNDQKEYTLEEIYENGGFSESLVTPAFQRINVCPTKNAIYSYYTSWKRSCINGDRTVSTYPLCQDALCDHSALPCVSFAALATNTLIEADNKLYMLADGKGDKPNKFIEYDLSKGEYRIIGEFVNGGKMLARVGRFVYFYVLRIDGQTASGQQLSTLLIHRYDLSSGTLEKISERSSKRVISRPVGANGYLWFLDEYNNLCRCDVGFKNEKKIISGKKIVTYAIDGDKIYYLTGESGEGWGELCLYDIEKDSTDILYSKVTWFCLSGSELFYSVYAPIDAFEWDFPTTDVDGKQVLRPKMISVKNGNMIYRIAAEKAGSRAGEVLELCDNLKEKKLFIGEAYAVYDGFLFTQTKEAYADGSRKGMLTGITAINLESSEAFNLEPEYVIYS